MDSPASGKVYQSTLSILVSSPMTGPNFYTREGAGAYCGNGYYNDEYSPPQSCPPPPTGPESTFRSFKKLSIDSDLNIDHCKHDNNTSTPPAPITNERRTSMECNDLFIHDENVDTNTVDTNTVDTNTVDINTVDTNTVDNNTVDTNTVDTNTVDTNTVDTNTVDTDDENVDTNIESPISPKCNILSVNRLRGFGDIGTRVSVETDSKSLSPINFDGVEYINNTPKTVSELIINPEENNLEDYRVDIVMRNMHVSKEEAHDFINSDENEENLCPLIERRDRVGSFDSVTSEEYNCDRETSPLHEKEKVIEKYEEKLNDLTLEIYEKQTRLEELELSLNRREERLTIKEKEFTNNTVFESALHILSCGILIGYVSTKVIGFFA